MRQALFAILLLAFAACTSSEQKAARALISEAQTSITEQRYEQALSLLDSLNKTYPALVDERKQALELSREVRLLQSQRDSIFLAPLIDSLVVKEAKALELFEAVQDETIQDHKITRYKGYDPTKAPKSSFLDVYFNNLGELELVAGTSGRPALESECVIIRDKASDTFVTSDTIPYDGGTNYRYEIDGRTYERITFTLDNAERLSAFVAGMGEDSKLQVELINAKGKKQTFALPAPAVKAIQASYELHRIKTELKNSRDQLTRHQKRSERYEKLQAE